MDEHVVPGNTLFIRNLPFFVTDEKLGEIFSETGPVKRAFVVKEKGNGNKSRGFGYVTYSFEEDAEKAKDTIDSIDGRKVFVTFAGKKKKLPENGSLEKKDETSSQAKKSKTSVKDSYQQTAKYEKTKTLVVSGFPESTPLEKVKENVESLKNIASLTYPVEKNGKNFALVSFRSIRDARRAMNKLNGQKLPEGFTLKAIQQSYDPNFLPSKVLKMRRLIVRNLAFTVSEEDLKKVFEKFGEVHEVVIPKKYGKKCGFGFVQFTNIQNANKAVLQMNKQEIQGRPVAVDWSVPKSVFIQSKESTEQKESSKKKETSDESLSSDLSDDDADNDDIDDDSGLSEEEEEEGEGDEEKKEEEESSSLSDSETDESESSSVSMSSLSESNANDSEAQSELSDDESEDEKDDDDDDDDSIIMEDDIKPTKNAKDNEKKPVGPPRKSDVGEGRTLFVRNVPFNCDQNELANLFTEYGKINYCIMPRDPSDMPKGTAFVQFSKKEDAEKCLENINQESGAKKMILDNRELLVSKALSREEATNLKNASKNEKKDSRNLYLAREGLIRAGMKAAEGLSKTDLNKRLKIEMTKRQKIRDPNIFISPLRLCVHNIPTHVDDKELRKIYLNAVKDKNAVINECRIMRDLDRTNAKGLGKSRGYGFVSFTDQRHALTALRNTNNNPDIFGNDKRLIVEFSLENKKALQAKQNRIEKAKGRQESLQGVAKERRKKKDILSAKDNPSSQSFASKKDAMLGGGRGAGKKSGRIMPSHIGAKKRHRDRGKIFTNQGKKVVKEKKIRQYEDSHLQNKHNKKNNQKRNRSQFSDDFDSLVSKYKKRMLSAGTKS